MKTQEYVNVAELSRERLKHRGGLWYRDREEVLSREGWSSVNLNDINWTPSKRVRFGLTNPPSKKAIVSALEDVAIQVPVREKVITAGSVYDVEQEVERVAIMYDKKFGGYIIQPVLKNIIFTVYKIGVSSKTTMPHLVCDQGTVKEYHYAGKVQMDLDRTLDKFEGISLVELRLYHDTKGFNVKPERYHV